MRICTFLWLIAIISTPLRAQESNDLEQLNQILSKLGADNNIDHVCIESTTHKILGPKMLNDYPGLKKDQYDVDRLILNRPNWNFRCERNLPGGQNYSLEFSYVDGTFKELEENYHSITVGDKIFFSQEMRIYLPYFLGYSFLPYPQAERTLLSCSLLPFEDPAQAYDKSSIDHVTVSTNNGNIKISILTKLKLEDNHQWPVLSEADFDQKNLPFPNMVAISKAQGNTKLFSYVVNEFQLINGLSVFPKKTDSTQYDSDGVLRWEEMSEYAVKKYDPSTGPAIDIDLSRAKSVRDVKNNLIFDIKK